MESEMNQFGYNLSPIPPNCFTNLGTNIITYLTICLIFSFCSCRWTVHLSLPCPGHYEQTFLSCICGLRYLLVAVGSSQWEQQQETGKWEQSELRVPSMTSGFRLAASSLVATYGAIYPRARGLCSGTKRCRWSGHFLSYQLTYWRNLFLFS